jgi:phosphatidylglycerol:prolipoprotein diacylglycerol transferase
MTAILCNLPRLVKGADPLEVWRSAGLVSFGGYAASIAAIILYCRLKAHDTLKALDIVFAYMGAFDIFQRVGCIFMGCCRGKPLMDTLGSPLNYIAGALGLARHPFPFYMLLLGLALLLWAAPALKRPHRPGEIFLKYFMFYSSIRFFLEFLRQEPVLAWLKPLTAPQAVCIVIFVTTFITLRQMRNKKTLNPKSETLNKS